MHLAGSRVIERNVETERVQIGVKKRRWTVKIGAIIKTIPAFLRDEYGCENNIFPSFSFLSFPSSFWIKRTEIIPKAEVSYEFNFPENYVRNV